MQLPSILLALFLVGFVIFRKLLELRRATRSIDNHPGHRSLFERGTGILNAFPTVPKVLTPPLSAIFPGKHTKFASFGWDVLTSITLFPIRITVTVADAAAMKEISASRSKFPKPVEEYALLTFFGRNIVASEKEDWKRYRKISAPAFSNRNNQLVWDETVNVVMDLFTNVWGEKDSIVVDHCLDLTLPLTLFIIGVAGFGRKMAFQDAALAPAGHELTFKEALNIVSSSIFVKIMVPNWAMSWTSRLRHIGLAFTELETYMKEMILSRRHTAEKEERWDLFSSLLDANEEENAGQAKLEDSELMGNIFIFLLAGHETTAHTLCFTLALLALYPKEQETLYEHIKSVIPDDRLPRYDEMPLFTQSMAVLYETLRLFPPVNVVPKTSAYDTTIPATSVLGEHKRVPIPEGAFILFDIPALHYNKRYWEEPELFKPARFLGNWPKDAFAPFSFGSRACLGRRFFETESIAILTMLISRYEVTVKEEPRFAHETFKERYDRITSNRFGITLTPVQVPLVFKRRSPVTKASLV